MTEGPLRAVAWVAGWGSHAWGRLVQALAATRGLCGLARYLATVASATPCCHAHAQHVMNVDSSHNSLCNGFALCAHADSQLVSSVGSVADLVRSRYDAKHRLDKPHRCGLVYAVHILAIPQLA